MIKMYCLMKKILLLSAAVLSILAAASCAKEEAGPESFRTVITASLSPTKTALGDKEGASWPNYWKSGDKISVNGVASDALPAEFDGKASASFSFEGLLETPYCAVYPAAAVDSYSEGSATVSLPASQKYVAGSYDPSAFIMGGKSTDASSVALSPCVSIVHISLDGTQSIRKVKLTGPDGAALSGTFSTDFSAYTPQSVSNVVEMVAESAVALPADFFICVPSGLVGSLKVEAFDTDGGSMTKTATIKSALAPGQMYSPATLPYTPSYDIAISAEGITSSTAVICWDNSPEAAYAVKVYSDAACTALVDNYEISAGNACWSDKSPRLCISGLAANTTYYVKVTNVAQNVDSNVLPVKTEAFEIVQVSSSPADVGDVILAEDFSELRWDSDVIGVGVGWFPTETAKASFGILGVDTWRAAETSSEKQLSDQTSALATSRLMHWAQGAKKNMYIHPGYIKLVGSSNVTHLVTPALDNIPDGMSATLEVEVTASAYYSESSASFCTDKAVIAVQSGTFSELLSGETNTLDLESNIAPITLKKEVAWNAYKVTISGVSKGDRLAFGADKSVSKNDARMNISDMKITLKELLAPGDLSLSLKEVSSSTASFTWTHVGSDAEYDISKSYLAAIYRDSECNNLVASYEIPAGSACWDGKQPSFVFAGLAPSTNYWCKVTDLTEDVHSEAVSCTTSAFTVVDAMSVSNAGVGDVILAEDFSELGWGAEELTASAGFYPSPKTLYVPSGAYTDDDGNFSKYNGQAGRLYGDCKVESDKRLFNWGFFGNSSVYAYAAYLRVGSSSKGARTSIVSPTLLGIPDGKKATIDVTVTAGQYANNTNDVAVFVEKASDLTLVLAPDESDNSNFSSKGGKYEGASLSEGYPLNAKTRGWTTSTVRISGVTNDNCLLFGSYENIDTKNRFFLSDVVVTIVELADKAGIEASLKSVSSSTAAFSWTHEGDAAYDISKPYTASLYSDAGCSSLVVSHSFDADASCWNGKIPCFSFGGLAPSTTYWLVVEDSESGQKSDPVSATTEAFTPVDVTKVSNAGIGDVILAEDFSEIGWGPDEFAVAAGFYPSPKNLLAPSGVNPSGSYTEYNNTGNRIFGSGVDLGDSRLSHGWGFFGNSAVYLRNAYLRIATTSSGARTHIVTPELSAIPDGKLATIEVTATVAKQEANDNDIAVFVENGLVLADETNAGSSDYKKYTGASLVGGNAFGISSSRVWETKSVTISNVSPDCQLVIGSLEDISGKNRFSISDIVVKIVDLADDSVPGIKDEATFMEFVGKVAAGEKTLDAKITSSFAISASAAEAFSSIEDYEGTLSGNRKTISGLTKPLFNELKGTVKDLTLNSTLNVTVDQADLGILANIVYGTVSGCTSKGSVVFNVAGGVSGEHRIGGLIGQAKSGSEMTGCTNEASVTNETAYASGNGGELIIGGVLGTFWGEQFSISNCTNTGAVINNGKWNKDVSVGGVIGQAGNGASSTCDLTVKDCTNSGDITNNGANDGSNNSVGGIVGYIRFGTYTGNSNSGGISNTGDAKQNRVGGLIGYLDKKATFDDNSNDGTVSNTGEATDINYVGGLIGRMQTDNIFKDNSNSGDIANSGDATNYVYIGGIVAYLDKNNSILEAGNSAKYKLTNSGDIENSGSAKNICIGGLFGRNSSGYFNMTGISKVYSSNSGNITDNSGPAKSKGGDLSIGGIAGYTTTGIKTQYARNSGDIYVTGDKGSTNINVGGIGGWISNASFNFNNCRNTGNVTVDCTTTSSIWAAGIVGCPKNNNTVHYYWYSSAVIDTHAATVGGNNYTAGLMGTHEGDFDTAYTTFSMYGHKLAGTVWGSKTTTGLFCCTKNTGYVLWVRGGSDHPNTIAPGTVRKDNTHDDAVNSIDDVTLDILSGGAGSSAIAINDPDSTESEEAKKPKKIVSLADAIDAKQIAVAEW